MRYDRGIESVGYLFARGKAKPISSELQTRDGPNSSRSVFYAETCIIWSVLGTSVPSAQRGIRRIRAEYHSVEHK